MRLWLVTIGAQTVEKPCFAIRQDTVFRIWGLIKRKKMVRNAKNISFLNYHFVLISGSFFHIQLLIMQHKCKKSPAFCRTFSTVRTEEFLPLPKMVRTLSCAGEACR